MTAWDATSSVVTVVVASIAILLAVACAWPDDSDRRSAPPCHCRRSRHTQETKPPLVHWSCELPGRPLSIAEAHQAMQVHREHDCARRRVALAMLIAEGRITPDSARRHRQWA